MLESVLVANRGEIALRVFRTCRELGVRTVAVFTDLDETAPHVRAADDAVRVESYLDVDAVVGAARTAGAAAVHPGYGFHSERAELARAVVDAGLVWIGPPADVIDLMGRKDVAREVAVRAGVPVVPSAELSGAEGAPAPGGPDNSAGLRFPLLVKAAAGGGGKGMRVVRDPAGLDEAVASARREAASAFGDDTVLLERYVEHGRHVEVQVLADAHGNVVHLFERDCSTQRRHQKVLEEAPAPTISDDVRRRLTDAAVALSREVGYVNAGTVEFLVDEAEVFFLEMNTRLQVEHPVTELTTTVRGEPLDLVRLQLAVAAGEPLPFLQSDVGRRGHAIEARVYAEDPFHGFLPQAGRASLVRWPGGRDGTQDAPDPAVGPASRRASRSGAVRVDAALEGGQSVSTSYDPMLGKVIAHGPTREAARRALVDALDDTAVLGLTTNVGFLRALAAGEEFRDATIDTAWLDSATVPEPPRDVARVFAAWTHAMLVAVADAGHPFQGDGWRLAGPPAATVVELDRPVVVDRARGLVDDVPVRELLAERHVVQLVLDGRREQAVVNVTAHQVEVVHQGHRHVFTRPDVFADPVAATGDGTVTAPMPGTVLAVRVDAGQSVTEGQVLGVLEAMKMELTLTAAFDGTVTRVAAATGDQVALGATLFVVEPDGDQGGGDGGG